MKDKVGIIVKRPTGVLERVAWLRGVGMRSLNGNPCEESGLGVPPAVRPL